MNSGKILVISDLHLTTKFSKKKFELLRKVIGDCDQLIINGDLWEGFAITSEQFISSEWRILFPLFKKKKAIYIFGNHDPEEGEVDYQSFADLAVKSYEFSQNGQSFYVTHGDYFDRTLDIRHPNLPKWLLNFGTSIEQFVISVFGRAYLRIYQKSNNKMKTWHRNNKTESWLICGHSHLAEVDNQNKFANSGLFLQAGLASYLIIEKGRVKLELC